MKTREIKEETENLTPEQIAWLKRHEHLHKSFMKWRRKFSLAADHITNEGIREKQNENNV
jgi:nicotinic acid phosphoribosyltransferase